MIKTLSQQLCELVGIEPKYQFNQNYNSCEKENCYEYACPNFENPNNFVKLLELEINKVTLTERLWYRDIYFFDRKTFIEKLIVLLNDEHDTDTKFIKKVIQEAEWEY